MNEKDWDWHAAEMCDIYSQDPNTWFEMKLGDLKKACDSYLNGEEVILKAWGVNPEHAKKIVHDMLECVLYENMIKSI